ncbi:MAG: acyl--CoA ligase [Gammaproteobacteria bacterium]|nr:acyl--CoA ligase [Gammaproteobacteria bacterium]
MADMTTLLPIEATTLGDLLLRSAQRHPQRDALVFPDVSLNYTQLWQASVRRARALHALGIGPGDHLGILLPNCPEYIEILLGTVLCGAVAVPINARNKAAELAYVIENADLAGLVTSDASSEYADFGGLLETAFSELSVADHSLALKLTAAPRLGFVVMLGASRAGFVSEEVFESAAEQVSEQRIWTLRSGVRLSDPCIMMYTSGTTAHPKGCPLSHENLVRNGISMNRQNYRLSERDRFWTPLPMFHMSSILPMVCCFDAGAAMLSMRRFEAGPALEMLEREAATIAFPSFPTVTNDLISQPDFGRRDLSRIRRINNVAPVDVLRRFQDAFPQAIQTGAYGLTEAAGVIAFNQPDEDLERRLTTCGVPFAGIEVRITDPDDDARVLPSGERGELWIRGYAVFPGYYRAPEKNAEAFTDGWFRTGDLCSVDAMCTISFHGRLKDMLKVGGENVAAVEIESHLQTHPSIRFAQVIGVPDARLQEVAAAYVELHEDEVLTEQDVIDHCRGRMAGFKVPRYVRFVTEWPMSATKVQKHRLRESFAAEASRP